MNKFRENGFYLYNKCCGGGGGRAIASELSSTYALKGEDFPTPKKNYPVVETENGFKIQFSPGFKVKLQRKREKARKAGKVISFAYRFKSEETRQVGITARPEVRGQEHLSKSEKGTSAFEMALKKDPTSFVYGVINIYQENAEENKENSFLASKSGDVEIELIKRARKAGTVFNSNSGGGGSRARSLCELNG